jgi:phosphate butyryltransferase
MPFKSFAEIERFLLDHSKKKTIVLAGSDGRDALESLLNARAKGIADVKLIGNAEKTRELLKQLGYNDDDLELINVPDNDAAAMLACEMVANKKADIPMKGNMLTSAFMHAILNKSLGYVKDKGLVSQATVFEFPKENRLMIMSDCAVNISPDYSDKCKILRNAIRLAKKIGIEIPKAAVITPLEVVNPNIQATIDAALIEKAVRSGQIKDCIAEGPLAFDIAVSSKAAGEKGVKSEVAGKADILLMPDLCVGNAMTKALTYFAEFLSAGCVAGTEKPVIMTSRTDTPENKYNSILMAVLDAIVCVD